MQYECYNNSNMTELGVGEIRRPIPIKPSRVVYAPDTLQGRIDAAVSKVKETVDFYFRGAKPLVPTRPESEKK